MSDSEVREGQIYRHFKKHTIYSIVCVATHSETEEQIVVYRDVSTGRCFVRPLTMFVEEKELPDGRRVKRFELESEHGGEKENAGP